MIEEERPPIEVGAARSNGTIRYWWAREAVRQGEARMAAQAAGMDALMGRAGSLVGWCVVAAIGLLTISARGAPSAAAVSSAVLALAAAGCCVAALWPRAWNAPGGSVAWALSEPLDTELEALESLAAGYEKELAENNHAMRRAGILLRAAMMLFVTAPVVGALVFVLSHP